MKESKQNLVDMLGFRVVVVIMCAAGVGMVVLLVVGGQAEADKLVGKLKRW